LFDALCSPILIDAQVYQDNDSRIPDNTLIALRYLSRSKKYINVMLNKGLIQNNYNSVHCVRKVPVRTDVIFVELVKKYGQSHPTTICRDIPNEYIPYLNAPKNIPRKPGFTMSKKSIVIWRF